jgi:chloramphenicol 3-O-phosphotransferase
MGRPTSPGIYLTDETNLFRCLPSEQPGVAVLEDCLTLVQVHCPFEEVASRMRLVPAQDPGWRDEVAEASETLVAELAVAR